jgi:hypothetical protein
MRLAPDPLRALAGLLCVALASGCGYTLQNSKSPLTESEGVRKIYVEPFSNDTYSPGVENVVYNAMIRTLSAGRRIELVPNRREADAILEGKVTAVSSTPANSVPASSLRPVGTGSAEILVAYEYTASLTTYFTLNRKKDRIPKGKPQGIWSASFSRSKIYPGNAQLGTRGTTTGLINASEFDRAVHEMADQMMADVHESMLAMF